MTLYGLPDETGYLKEGEIFVVTEKAPEGGKKVLVKNNVVVTRSPALHPGDIQLVNAVDVPQHSPLRQLSNVVVFSKWGARDLPSMLSGGDLDGDLYNVIWSVFPQSTDFVHSVNAATLGAQIAVRNVQRQKIVSRLC